MTIGVSLAGASEERSAGGGVEKGDESIFRHSRTLRNMGYMGKGPNCAVRSGWSMLIATGRAKKKLSEIKSSIKSCRLTKATALGSLHKSLPDHSGSSKSC